ncbi:unnamed protein product [Brassicogethes aeneus]|uniref:DUF4218 domain-containing protein n=1 Tax=Brassicogethes aeneus TaxID=1431903 RepID=A0A9P0FIC7_BRAAE|nr:unnamed protein product [Brassicogethes aeneus]
MSAKFKKFADLSARHRRRILARIRARKEALEVHNVHSSSDESNPFNDDVIHETAPFNGDNVLTNQNNEPHNEENNEIVAIVENEQLENNNNAIVNDVGERGGEGGEDVEIERGDIRRRALHMAFLKARLNHTQVKCILDALRAPPFNMQFLPMDPRSMLKTPNLVVTNLISHTAGGEFLHLGFEDIILKKLVSIPADQLPENVTIDFSTDGGQLYKTGSLQFWPIQFRILNIDDKRPMISGVFIGESKPSNPSQFFNPFVAEVMKVINQGGLILQDRVLPLQIKCFIADAPARAFALNHYSHNSAHGCHKCKVVGHRCTVQDFRGTEVFLSIDNDPRTDDEYRAMVDKDHHKGESPLSPFLDLVSKTPVEIMHLVYIGALKKTLDAVIGGKFGFQRLSGRKIDILDSRMKLMRDCCPSDFNRRPEPMSRYSKFKATQLRQLLLYTGPAVFRNVLGNDHYRHLMLLHAVMRLLNRENPPEELLLFCEASLRSYVTLCLYLYKEQYMSYNIHCLLHIVDDVRGLGPIDSYSAFCYENSMPNFRDLATHRPYLALQQYYKRIKEKDQGEQPFHVENQIVTSKKRVAGPLPINILPAMCEQFEKVSIGSIILSTSRRDSCCILRNSEICVIRNIIRVENDIMLIVTKFQQLSSLYEVGYTSNIVGVFHCKRLSNTLTAVSLRDIERKCYRMPLWSNVEGREEEIVENEYICATMITPIVMPPH